MVQMGFNWPCFVLISLKYPLPPTPWIFSGGLGGRLHQPTDSPTNPWIWGFPLRKMQLFKNDRWMLKAKKLENPFYFEVSKCLEIKETMMKQHFCFRHMSRVMLVHFYYGYANAGSPDAIRAVQGSAWRTRTTTTWPKEANIQQSKRDNSPRKLRTPVSPT